MFATTIVLAVALVAQAPKPPTKEALAQRAAIERTRTLELRRELKASRTPVAVRRTKAAPAPDPTEPGFKGTLKKGSRVSVNYLFYLEFVKAVKAQDRTGFANLIEKKKLVVLEEDTPVLVIRHLKGVGDFTGGLEVRLLEGAYKEQSGFTDELPVN